MLRCSIADVKSGMIVGSPVVHPNRADIELLSFNVELDERMIIRLSELGVEQIWIHHDATKDLDLIVSPKLSEARRTVYNQLKKNVSRMAMQSVTTVQVDTYARAVQSLVYELVSNGKIADLTELLFDSEAELFSHASNVAYLSLMLGLELQTYIYDQRKWLSYQRSRDLTPLGLGAMLHDIGKAVSQDFPELPNIHEANNSDTTNPHLVRAYTGHVLAGYKLLSNSGVPASAREVVVNHHQRYDGSGWPEEDGNHKRHHTEAQIGDNIFIYSRIVAVANVLDNLLRDAEGYKRPPVAALYELQSERFAGWFDPVIQHVALRRLPPFPLGSQVTLSNEASAVVIKPNLKHPCRPMVRLLDESLHNVQGKYPTLNLDLHPDLHIATCGGVNVEQWLYDIPDAPPVGSNVLCSDAQPYIEEPPPQQETPPQQVIQQVTKQNTK
jgi:HD-GYP domain-containing protein (c-di-GMP phosphodiesterase class II)